jgi:hypothetical protein
MVLWRITLFVFCWSVFVNVGLRGNQLLDIPVATIIAAGEAIPNAIPITASEGDMLDLVAGRGKLPNADSLRLSIWAVGGQIQAPVLRGQPLDGAVLVKLKDIVRLRFKVPPVQARPGAMLRLVISDATGERPIAEAWLTVVVPFDPSGLRHWFDKHPVAIDHSLIGVLSGFKKWGISTQNAENSSLIFQSGDSAGAAIGQPSIVFKLSDDGRSRVVVYRDASAVWRIEAALSSLDIADSAAVRREFMIVLREAARLFGDASEFPDI